MVKTKSLRQIPFHPMVGEWVSYMRSDSCDSLQVNYRIHLLCQGTVHSEGVHFDTVQIQYVSPRLDNVHFVMWIGCTGSYCVYGAGDG